MTINAIFPLPLFMNKATGETFNNINDELTNVADNIDFSHREGWDSNTHMLTPNAFERNILVDYDCKNFIKFLEECIYDFVYPILKHDGFDYCMSACWMTKTLKNQYAKEHHHGTADISGVYYVDTTGDDGNLFFDNIHSSACSNPLISKINAKEIMPLENGLIMMWPGYLKHGTFSNKTDHARISLSFNLTLSRAGFSKDILSRIRL